MLVVCQLFSAMSLMLENHEGLMKSKINFELQPQKSKINFGLQPLIWNTKIDFNSIITSYPNIQGNFLNLFF
ncbi:hypothetical protein BGP_3371 [Beggiatoa sp. PS]|nr:hypothetical protein BGP_3371 [Beggiatoa sp. PS]